MTSGNKSPRYPIDAHERAFKYWNKYQSFTAVSKLPGMPATATVKQWSKPSYPCNCGWHGWEDLRRKVKVKGAELLAGKQAPDPRAVEILKEVKEVLCPECLERYMEIVSDQRLRSLSIKSIEKAKELEDELSILAESDLEKLSITRMLKDKIKGLAEEGLMQPKSFKEMVDALDRIDKIEQRIANTAHQQGTSISIAQHRLVIITVIQVVMDAIRRVITEPADLASIASEINSILQHHSLMAGYKAEAEEYGGRRDKLLVSSVADY